MTKYLLILPAILAATMAYVTLHSIWWTLAAFYTANLIIGNIRERRPWWIYPIVVAEGALLGPILLPLILVFVVVVKIILKIKGKAKV